MPKMIRRLEPTEHEIQCAIVEWANITPINKLYGMIGDYLIAYPNGRKRYIGDGVKLKKEGVKAGVSDLFLAWPVTPPRRAITLNNENTITIIREYKFHGLWIELKTKVGNLRENQLSWIRRMEFINYKVAVVRSVDEGIQAIKDYLGMR